LHATAPICLCHSLLAKERDREVGARSENERSQQLYCIQLDESPLAATCGAEDQQAYRSTTGRKTYGSAFRNQNQTTQLVQLSKLGRQNSRKLGRKEIALDKSVGKKARRILPAPWSYGGGEDRRVNGWRRIQRA
jgi:hypothetical protein